MNNKDRGSSIAGALFYPAMVALGAKPNRKLAKQIKNLGFEFYMAGYCINPHDLLESVSTGFKIAINL